MLCVRNPAWVRTLARQYETSHRAAANKLSSRLTSASMMRDRSSGVLTASLSSAMPCGSVVRWTTAMVASHQQEYLVSQVRAADQTTREKDPISVLRSCINRPLSGAGVFFRRSHYMRPLIGMRTIFMSLLRNVLPAICPRKKPGERNTARTATTGEDAGRTLAVQLIKPFKLVHI
jgi:hypothetical protein